MTLRRNKKREAYQKVTTNPEIVQGKEVEIKKVKVLIKFWNPNQVLLSSKICLRTNNSRFFGNKWGQDQDLDRILQNKRGIETRK